MAIDRIFPNPTVKQVIFAIRFPNLFYLDGKIGDFQMRVMEHFPDSELLFRRHITFADVGPKADIGDIPEELRSSTGKKIWQFKSENRYELNVTSDSLDITSEIHKTYQLGEGHKFRDIIQFVVQSFLETVQLPKFTRMGLRYVDECPIFEKTDAFLKEYYNSTFPLGRFSLDDAIEMDFKTVVRRGHNFLRYVESLQRKASDESHTLIMDFDGYTKDVASSEYLKVLDGLHTLISDEYESSIRQPLLDFMSREEPQP